jgi:hypothetical protein
MDTGSIDATGISRNGALQYGGDQSLYVVFEPRGKKTQDGSIRQAHFITIHVPGGKNTVIREATDADKARFRPQWNAYEMGQAQAVNGTPLSEWPILCEQERAELRTLNIFSVEQIAQASDITLQAMGPNGRELQRKARDYLDLAKESQKIEQVANENLMLKEQLAVMAEKFAEFEKAQSGKSKSRSKKKDDDSESEE